MAGKPLWFTRENLKRLADIHKTFAKDTSTAFTAVNETFTEVYTNLEGLDTRVTELEKFPSTRKINGKPLSADVTLSAKDVGALPTTGGTLTGNITGKYITGTWLQTTASTNLGRAPVAIPVLDGSGWLYKRTPSELLSDMGGVPKSEIRTPKVVDGVLYL